jgi:cytochrome c peroxidase
MTPVERVSGQSGRLANLPLFNARAACCGRRVARVKAVIFSATVLASLASTAAAVGDDFQVPGLHTDFRGLCSDCSPLTLAKAFLGCRLFFDKRFSINNETACASCHVPDHAFSGDKSQIMAVSGSLRVERIPPSLMDASERRAFTADGSVRSLAEQVQRPVTSAEMGPQTVKEAATRLAAVKSYAQLASIAFADSAVSDRNIIDALLAWLGLLRSGTTRFERWYYHGERNLLSESEQRGYGLFMGKAGCEECHVIRGEGTALSDESFHNTGVGAKRLSEILIKLKADGPPRLRAFDIVDIDVGEARVTGRIDDIWKFKTRDLRNLRYRSSFMHDGSLDSIDDVVNYYNKGGFASPLLDPLIWPRRLSKDERQDLIDFLGTLNSDTPMQIADVVQRLCK